MCGRRYSYVGNCSFAIGSKNMHHLLQNKKEMLADFVGSISIRLGRRTATINSFDPPSVRTQDWDTG